MQLFDAYACGFVAGVLTAICLGYLLARPRRSREPRMVRWHWGMPYVGDILTEIKAQHARGTLKW